MSNNVDTTTSTTADTTGTIIMINSNNSNSVADNNKIDNNSFYYYSNNNNTKSSTTEKCGFILHIFTILIGFLYYYNIGFIPKTIQILTTTTTATTIPYPTTDTIATNTNTSTSDNIVLIVNSISYFDMIGPILVICILIVPIIVYLLNKYIAMSSSYDSFETIYDDYNLIIQQQQQKRNDSKQYPEEVDDVATISISPIGTSRIAEIIDIDVGVINDLLSSSSHQSIITS